VFGRLADESWLRNPGLLPGGMGLAYAEIFPRSRLKAPEMPESARLSGFLWAWLVLWCLMAEICVGQKIEVFQQCWLAESFM